MSNKPPTVAPPASRRDDRRDGNPSPVAPGVHAGGELEGAVERTLQHGNRNASHASQAGGRYSALASCLAHDPDGLHQLGGEGQGHGHRYARFVEHRGKRAEQPVRARQGVRRTEAEQDHGELQSEHEGVQNGLQRDRTTDTDGSGPRGQRYLRQREEDVTGNPSLAEEDLDHDSDDDDEDTEAKEERDGPRPGRAAPPGRHDHAGHGSDQCQQERVVRPHGADRQGRPPTTTTPPGAGSGAWGRRPVSFLRRPPPPTHQRVGTQSEDDRPDQRGGEHVAGRPAAGAPVRGRSCAPAPMRTRTIRGSRHRPRSASQPKLAWLSSHREPALTSWWWTLRRRTSTGCRR